MSELVCKHQRVDAASCGPRGERVSEHVGVDGLAHFGGLAEALDEVRQRVLGERLIDAPRSLPGEEDPPAAFCASSDVASKVPAQVGR